LLLDFCAPVAVRLENLAAPRRLGVIAVLDTLDALREPREILELRPLVVGDRERDADVDRLLDVHHLRLAVALALAVLADQRLYLAGYGLLRSVSAALPGLPRSNWPALLPTGPSFPESATRVSASTPPSTLPASRPAWASNNRRASWASSCVAGLSRRLLTRLCDDLLSITDLLSFIRAHAAERRDRRPAGRSGSGPPPPSPSSPSPSSPSPNPSSAYPSPSGSS